MVSPASRQSYAEARAERHARSFAERQRPKVDQRVVALEADRYNALQISSILRLPVADVRLMLAISRRTSK